MSHVLLTYSWYVLISVALIIWCWPKSDDLCVHRTYVLCFQSWLNNLMLTISHMLLTHSWYVLCFHAPIIWCRPSMALRSFTACMCFLFQSSLNLMLTVLVSKSCLLIVASRRRGIVRLIWVVARMELGLTGHCYLCHLDYNAMVVSEIVTMGTVSSRETTCEE
jgi:hypothetical protein